MKFLSYIACTSLLVVGTSIFPATVLAKTGTDLIKI